MAKQVPNSEPVDPSVVHDPSTIIVEHDPKDPNSPDYQENQALTIADLDSPPLQVPANGQLPTPNPR